MNINQNADHRSNETAEAFSVKPEPPIVIDLFGPDPRIPLDMLVQGVQYQFAGLLAGAVQITGKTIQVAQPDEQK